MTWNSALNRKLFDSRPDAEIKGLLRSLLPPFSAPTDPRDWTQRISGIRRQLLDEVFLKGYPDQIVKTKPQVFWGDVLQPDLSYRIRKLRYEIYPDFWIPALMYEPVNSKGKMPVALALMGHGSGGKATIAHQILCANLARRGILTLNPEFIGMGELGANRVHANIAHINLTGMSGVGLFYLACKKGLDLALTHPKADKKRVAATGCSGGGWQTIVISALDTRITLSVPVAGYTSLRARVEVQADIGDLEQNPPDLAKIADYQTLTAMLAPRPALIILNEMDNCCFATARTRPVVYDAVKPVYKALGAGENFETYSNIDPGTHNYDADNRSQFYKFVSKHFKLECPDGDIHTQNEILPESSLNIGLPESQEHLLTIAIKQARRLNTSRKPQKNEFEKKKLRKQLSELLRLPDYPVQDSILCQTGRISQHIFKVGPFSVPATVHSAENSQEVEIWIAAGGRSASGNQLSDEQKNIFALDIFGTGENASRWNLQMLLECAGQRILGIQVGQIIAVSKWIRRQTGIKRLELFSNGLRTQIASLIAAALAPELFKQINVSGVITSLSELIEIPCRYTDDLPLFAFGLLETADISEMKMLLEDVGFVQSGRNVPVEFPGKE